MSFTVTTRTVQAGGRSDTAIQLADESARIEVWPAFGFNCLRWQVRRSDGGWGDALFCDPNWEQNPVPTRSGHPILFPFPNRLRNGRFTQNGRTYQLPLNDTTGTHAIHGFTPRNAWRVLAAEGGAESATVTGQFQLSRDLPASLSHWPADFVLTVTYRLTTCSLTVEAEVENPDSKPLPFGLGYHPYFVCPNVTGSAVDEMTVWVGAAQIWDAVDNLPTGRVQPVSPDFDFRSPRVVGGRQLDTLYTGISGSGDIREVAWLGHSHARGQIVVSADSSFRELLLFAPPHRRAMAIEPYTCATDAANIPNSGWQTLPAGGRFGCTVRYSWHPV